VPEAIRRAIGRTGRMGWRLSGARALERRRASILANSHAALGDVLLYLARGGPIRDLAEVRDAPLEDFSLDGETYSWYARRAWEDLAGIDLLFVDGPPAATGHQARYPALPLLNGSLSPAAAVVLDDLVVPDMQKVLRLWLDTYPGFVSEILSLEKQAAVLRRS